MNDFERPSALMLYTQRMPAEQSFGPIQMDFTEPAILQHNDRLTPESNLSCSALANRKTSNTGRFSVQQNWKSRSKKDLDRQ